MAVQIQPAKPKDQHNGLVDLEAEILRAEKGHQVVAVVTYERVKRVEDESKDETYPVLRVKHIEPITGAESLEAVRALQLSAYQHRTGENELDFDGVDVEGGDDE